MGLRRQTCAAHIQQKDDGLRGAHNIHSSIQAARHPTDISVSPCLLQYDKWREAHIQTRTDNSQGIDAVTAGDIVMPVTTSSGAAMVATHKYASF